jgi:D-glycero-D-manno-heptose 1,7-bisphosphate phosphatase
MAITQAVVDPLALDDAYVCVHDGTDGCPCRKPRPGLLTAAVADWGIALGESWLIGDRWVDVVAGRDAGVRTVLLRSAHSDDPSGGVPPPAGLEPDLEVVTLDAAVSAIVGTSA